MNIATAPLGPVFKGTVVFLSMMCMLIKTLHASVMVSNSMVGNGMLFGGMYPNVVLHNN